MAKKRSRRKTREVKVTEVQMTTKRKYVRIERFVPKPCVMCPAQRKYAFENKAITKAKLDNPSEVYSKHGRVRYCRCTFCHHTWSQAESYS